MKRPTAQVKQSIISLQKLYVMPPLKGSFRELKVGAFFEKRKKERKKDMTITMIVGWYKKVGYRFQPHCT